MSARANNSKRPHEPNPASVRDRIEGVHAVPAVKTVLVRSQDLLDDNATAILQLKSSLHGDAASREQLLKITANLAKIKDMYDDLLKGVDDDDNGVDAAAP